MRDTQSGTTQLIARDASSGQQHSGKWFAFLTIETAPKPLPENQEVVGIDVGLSHFATLSTAEKIEYPRFLLREEKAVSKAHRRLAKLEKGSKQWRKAKKTLVL